VGPEGMEKIIQIFHAAKNDHQLLAINKGTWVPANSIWFLRKSHPMRMK